MTTTVPTATANSFMSRYNAPQNKEPPKSIQSAVVSYHPSNNSPPKAQEPPRNSIPNKPLGMSPQKKAQTHPHPTAETFFSKLTANPSNPGATTTKPANQFDAPPIIPGQLLGKCINLEMTNGDHSRFEVHVGYNKTLIEIFKAMKSKRYDPDTKRWNFSTRDYDELMAQVRLRLGNTVKLEPLERHPMGSGKSTQVKFTLSDRQRFEVQADYMPELKTIFDSIRSRKYDPNTKKYSFELRDYDELFKKISEKFTKGEVSLVALPKVYFILFFDDIQDLLFFLDAIFFQSELKPRI